MSTAEEYQLNPYLGWQKEQGIPIHTGFFVEDLRKVALGFWQARNANGAFINLSNAVVNDAVVLEVPAGKKTIPRRQLFDESVMIVEGQGATSMWYEDGRKKTFEWQQGSVFAIPPNVWHEHYAMSAPARLVSCTSAPLYMQLFNSDDFLFNCDYKFLDRYAEEENYFAESPKLLRGFKGIETNLIADVRQWFTRENVYALEEKGGFRQSRDRAHDAFSMRVRFAKTMMFLHLSGWSPGTYKKAHRHGPGFNIVILDGEGFSFMWEEGKKRNASIGMNGACSCRRRCGFTNISTRASGRCGFLPFTLQGCSPIRVGPAKESILSAKVPIRSSTKTRIRRSEKHSNTSSARMAWRAGCPGSFTKAGKLRDHNVEA